MPSETIPDQSLTVRDIMLRYTRGQITLPSVETGDDDDIDDLDMPDDVIDAHNAYLDGVVASERVNEMNKRKMEQTSQDGSGVLKSEVDQDFRSE